MQFFCHPSKSILFIFFAGLLSTCSAYAVNIVNITDEVLAGSNGIINVTESFYDWGNGTYQVNYAVDILNESASTSVSAFGVSTNTLHEGGWVNELSAVVSGGGWQAVQLNAATWNNGYSLNIGSDLISTNEIGLFESLFGGDLYVNMWL